MHGDPRQLEFELFGPELPASLTEGIAAGEDELPFASGFSNRESAPVAEESDGSAPTADQLITAEERLQAEARKLASVLGQTRLSMSIQVRWNYRMRTAAGRAHYRKSLIELNPRLMMLGEDRDDEIDRTMKHELAHLIAFARAGGKSIQPHGAEWKLACTELGIGDEDRCHQLPFQPRRMKRKYLYRCPACHSEVPRVRKFKRPVACYDCCKLHARGRFDQRFKLQQVK